MVLPSSEILPARERAVVDGSGEGTPSGQQYSARSFDQSLRDLAANYAGPTDTAAVERHFQPRQECLIRVRVPSKLTTMPVVLEPAIPTPRNGRSSVCARG